MKKSFILLFACLVTTMVSANNISVSNIRVSGQNIGGKFTMVQFDISWENSWRTTANSPANWDAAWVFVKYRINGGTWNQATLSTFGHIAPTGSLIGPASDGTGAFIYRNADGSGTFSLNGVQLRWNYGVNGLADNAYADIRVYAVEMVYVPEGAFSVGSGGTETGAFFKYPTTTNPYPVTGEGEITVGTGTGNLYYNVGAPLNIGDQSGPVPAAFPKGFNAFYCMKYEISQQEYVDFLNTLSYPQQVTRTAIAPNSLAGTYLYNAYRNKIKVNTSGVAASTPAVYATDFPDVACNDLSWADLAAFLDWSGLRPMTELEFEKACRGTIAPVADEYAWGTNGIAALAYTLNNNGAYNEIIGSNFSPDGNAAYNLTTPLNGSINGPVRTGIFAGTPDNAGRVTAGATYYGIMEMSGNLRERPVTMGNVTGRAFNGTHGNGMLDPSGNADASTWPGTDAVGAGFRGGNWNLNAAYLRVSNRSNAANAANNRSILYGGRGVRTAP